MAFDVVIAGGGFGGLYAARRLERRLPRHSARITVVSDVNFLLYTPLLPGAAAGTLEPRHVVVPIREELEWAELQLSRVTGADPAVNEVYVRTLDERDETLRYDQLVIALGSVSRVLPIPGLAEHALGFKTLADAIAVRNRALLNLEIAESLPDDESRREYLTFVFVGAGYAGVEALAELADLVRDALRYYPTLQTVPPRWVLVDAAPKILPEIPGRLGDYAAELLRRRGVDIRVNTTLDKVEPHAARLSDGTQLLTSTVVWTAGVKAHPLLAELGLPLDERGRVKVDETLQVEGTEDVWALGDCAAVPNLATPGRVDPPTSQHALRQARRLAKNLAGETRPYRYRTLGEVATLGRYKGIANVFGFPLKGFLGWWVTRTYHLYQLPLLSRKLRVVTDWTVALFFRRDIAELGTLEHRQGLGG